jgi:hypothetical protein
MGRQARRGGVEGDRAKRRCPRVNFIKSPYDDDLKAATCPADTAACRQKSYLVAGDLVLTGQSLGPFTCVTYQSPQARQPSVTTAWLPASALTPVAPMASPKLSDWTGAWSHPFGKIRISPGEGGKVSPTCANSGGGPRQINALAKKSPLHFCGGVEVRR